MLLEVPCTGIGSTWQCYYTYLEMLLEVPDNVIKSTFKVSLKVA